MIKIISKPSYFVDTCFKCGCEYSYEYEDITSSYTLPGTYFTTCPVCNSQNSHSGKIGAVYDGFAD